MKYLFNILTLSLFVIPAAFAGQGQIIQQSTSLTPITFTLVSVVDGITPVTGATPIVKISKVSGGVLTAAISPSGAISAVDTTNQPGVYQIAGNSNDTNTLGIVHVTATAAGAIQRDFDVTIVAYNPNSATNLGLSALPAASPTTSGGLATVGTGTGQMNLSGSGAVTLPATAPSTFLSSDTTLNAIKSSVMLASGVVTSGIFTSKVFTTSVFTTDNAFAGDMLVFTSGVNYGESILISSSYGTWGLVVLADAAGALPSTGDTFVIIPHPASGSRFLAALGPDHKPLISSTDTQAASEVWGASSRTLTGGATASVTPGATTLYSPAGSSNGAPVKAVSPAVAGHQRNRYTYNPVSHVLQPLKDDGVTPDGSPITLIFDLNSHILSQ